VDGGSGIHKGEGSIYTLDLVEETVCRLSTGYEGARFEDEALEGLIDQSLLNTGKSVFISEGSSELSCWYANATSLTPEKLEELRSLCIEKTYDVFGLLLVGDFNFTELDWSDNLEAKILTETESAAEFVKCLSEGFLTQNVCFKTFQKEPNKLTNILDLIITEAQERMDNLEPGEVLGGKEN
ncbi:RNA-directed DNA polymerase from mobile element jockey-like, partial [Brachionus plicatilis]